MGICLPPVRYLLHDARLSLGEGDMASALVLNVLNLDLAASGSLAGHLFIVVIVVIVTVAVALDLLELFVNMVSIIWVLAAASSCDNDVL